MSSENQPADSQIPSGSEKNSEPEFLVVGRISRAHGVHGNLVMAIITDYPERLVPGREIYLGDGHDAFTIEMIQRHQKDLLLRLEGITSRDEAELLRGVLVYLHITDAIPLEEGEYFLYQLHGISVYTDDGLLLGTFSGYLETGANDVYIIEAADGREILLPAISDVIKEVDLKAGKMTVHLIDGLLDK